jgi:SAM-dependent methyltransferase
MPPSQSILEPGNLLMVQERERFLSRLFREEGIRSLANFTAFEAGCYTAYNLRLLVQWGASPQGLAGMDADPEAATYVAAHSPEIRIHTGSADSVPEQDDSFDLSIAFTLFSSVPDEDIAHGIARELVRVTKPGGLIVVYDMRRRNPANRSVHPIRTDDIRRWFPRCPLKVHAITLAPPIARPVGRWAPWLYGPLSFIPLLRTHAMYVLRRPALPPIRVDYPAPGLAGPEAG